MRHWRRGRADASWGDVVEEVYVGVVSAAVLGSMFVSGLLGVGQVSDLACTSSGCRSARTVLPWVAVLGALLVVLMLARLLGPVFASPATARWLLPSPLPHELILRPRLTVMLTTSGLASGALVAAVFTSVGSSVALLALGSLLAAAAALLVMAAAAVDQGGATARSGRWQAALGLLVWAALAAQAVGAIPASAVSGAPPGWWWTLPAATALGAAGVTRLARRRLARLRMRDLAPGGDLVPGLSGAFATLDLSLVHDLVLAHRWRRRGSVVPRRGGPSGAMALVHSDLGRLRRSPRQLLVVAAVVVVPWSVASAGAGRATVLVAVLTGFLVGLPLLGALRVLTRTPTVARTLPFPPAVSRACALVVPLASLLIFGLSTTPPLHEAVGGAWADAAAMGLAVGVAATAASARWVTGRPPDYGRPMVSTPAGAVPTNLYGSVLRGFDIALLTSAPMLLSPTAAGAGWTVVVAGAVLAYLVQRR